MSGGRAVFIVNPASAGGSTGRAWPQLAAAAAGLGLEVDARLTRGRGDATAFARAAVRAGEPLVVVVGGDGTVNEAVNGFAQEPAADGARAVELIPTATRLGVVMRGTGGDFIRGYGIPKDALGALGVLVSGRARRIDLAEARFRAADGGEATRLYANAASCGMTGAVAARVNRSGARLAGTPKFLAATLATFATWRNRPCRVTIDGVEHRLVANNIVCANGRAFGGGMLVAPRAEPDDGLLEVVLMGDVTRLDLVLNLHRLYRGTLGRHPKVQELQGREIRVEADGALPVELDGEQPGTTPASFRVLPGALELMVPAALPEPHR